MVLTRSVDTDLLEALSGAFFYPVILVYLDWPENEIRLHSGVGTISWGGEDWLGVGSFGEVRLPEEAFGLGSQPATLSLVGLPDDLDEQLEAPIRNRSGTIYFGATTERAGNVLVGEPFAIYDGYMDALTDKVEGSDGKLSRRIILSLASGPSQRSYAEVYHTYEDQARAYPGPQPSYAYDFVGASALPTGVSLTRASTGYYENSDGTLTAFASGAARLGDRGLLLESAATNLAVRSQQLATTWTRFNIDIASDALAAPDGTTTAETLTLTGAGNAVIYQTITVAASTQYTLSFWAKRGTVPLNECLIRLYNQTSPAIFEDEVPYSPAPGTTDWVRVKHTFTTPSGCTSIRIYPLAKNSPVGGTLHMWGVQLELGARATSYIPTTSAAATRAADVATATAVANGDWDILPMREGGGVFADVTTSGGTGWTVSQDADDPYLESIAVYPDGDLSTAQKALLVDGETLADTAGRLTINAEAEGQKLRWPE